MINGSAVQPDDQCMLTAEGCQFKAPKPVIRKLPMPIQYTEADLSGKGKER